MTLWGTQPWFALLALTPPLLFTFAAHAETPALDDEPALSVDAPETESVGNDLCAVKRVPPLIACGGSVADYFLRPVRDPASDKRPVQTEASKVDSARVAAEPLTSNIWKTVPSNELVEGSRPRAQSHPAVRSLSGTAPGLSEEKARLAYLYDVRRLQQRVREELGGWSPTGLRTLMNRRKKIGVELKIRFK